MGIDREKAIAALIEAIGESDLSAFGQQDHRPGEYRIDGWIDPASIFDAMLSAFAAQDFAIVPKDPTEEMRQSYNNYVCECRLKGVLSPDTAWSAMIAAAQEQPNG